MAIAFDSVETALQNANVGATLTFAHTCTGSNLVLFVNVVTGGGGVTISGVTYNGVAMTAIDTAITNGGPNQGFYLFGPASGTNNVVVTVSSGFNAGISAVAASYTGVLQTALDNHNKNGPTLVDGYSQSIIPVADNCWAVWCVFTGATMTAGANTTLRAQETAGFGTALADNNVAIHPAGNTTVTVSTGAGATNWSSFLATIAPSGVVASSSFNISLIKAG